MKPPNERNVMFGNLIYRMKRRFTNEPERIMVIPYELTPERIQEIIASEAAQAGNELISFEVIEKEESS
jgi:hypothetical protein